MDSDLQWEDILIRVRDQLKKNNIKLWMQPYYHDMQGLGTDEEQAIQLLSEQITEELNIGQEKCIAALKELQNRALHRLKSDELYKETGVATLKIKVCDKDSTTMSLDIPLTSVANLLVDEISQRVGLGNKRLKLICKGKVLEHTETLISQGVKNGAQLMAVVLADRDNVQEEEKRLQILESTKEDLSLLTDEKHENGHQHFQIENQSGTALDIPSHERKLLLTAMTFHEKGRVALKQLDYSLALIMFLEADKAFSSCTSQLLSNCDNYALLHLDIAWCYLCLRSPAHIPDADRRLSLCEQTFHKCYGVKMERLLTLKGTTGNEMVLYMRLHLLQGVVYFHQNRRAEAKRMFERALSELQGLKVDDKSMTILMELGFSSAEARLGLRATYGNVEAAEELITRKRQEKEASYLENEAKLKLEREQQILGLCKDGKQFCDPQKVNQMTDMGFNHSQSVAALKMTNNVISDAIMIIQQSPHLLPISNDPVSEQIIAQITSLGFDSKFVRKAIKKYPFLAEAFTNIPIGCQLDPSGASSSTSVDLSSTITFLKNLKKKEQFKKEQTNEAFGRIADGISDHDLAEDHLDLNLDQEEEFLFEYMSLLNY